MASAFFHRVHEGQLRNEVFEIARIPVEGELVCLPDPHDVSLARCYRAAIVQLVVKGFGFDAEIYLDEVSSDAEDERALEVITRNGGSRLPSMPPKS